MNKLITEQIEITREDTFPVEVEGYVNYFTDCFHGSDADGNRGYCKKTICSVDDVMAFDVDGNTFDLNPNEIEQAKEAITDKFLLDN